MNVPDCSWPPGVVDEVLVQRAAHTLGDGAVHLAFHDHRVDHPAGVLHAHDPLHVHLAGVEVDCDHCGLRARRERAGHRVIEAHRLEAGLDAGREPVRFEVGHVGDLAERDTHSGRVLCVDEAVVDAQTTRVRLRAGAPQ